MKKLTKVMIKTFLISGFAYAGTMAVFYYLRGKGFDILLFIINFLLFGCCISLVERYKYKKRENTK